MNIENTDRTFLRRKYVDIGESGVGGSNTASKSPLGFFIHCLSFLCEIIHLNNLCTRPKSAVFVTFAFNLKVFNSR